MKGKLCVRKRYPGTARVNCSLEDDSGRILAQAFAATREDELELRRLTALPDLLKAVKGLLEEAEALQRAKPGFRQALWNPRRKAVRSRRIGEAQAAILKAMRGKG